MKRIMNYLTLAGLAAITLATIVFPAGYTAVALA